MQKFNKFIHFHTKLSHKFDDNFKCDVISIFPEGFTHLPTKLT
jgi:hypothetical protein